MPTSHNLALIVGASLSALAALLHVGIIVGGASWYRFFGAGQAMARACEQGRWYPAIVTVAIAVVLAFCSAYALSGAGVIAALPWLKPALCAIASIYLLRGLVLVPVLIMSRTAATPFWFWSSAICLVFGAAHLIGLIQVWDRL